MHRVVAAVLFGTTLAFAGCLQPALAQDSSALPQGFKVEPVIKSGKTADGEPLKYPRGDKPEVVSVIGTLEAGGRTALHQHPVPVFVYLLEGTLTVKQEGQKTRTYKQGDAFLETVGHWHQAFNESDKPAKVL